MVRKDFCSQCLGVNENTYRFVFCQESATFFFENRRCILTMIAVIVTRTLRFCSYNSFDYCCLDRCKFLTSSACKDNATTPTKWSYFATSWLIRIIILLFFASPLCRSYLLKYRSDLLNLRFTAECKKRWNMTQPEIDQYWSECISDPAVPKGARVATFVNWFIHYHFKNLNDLIIV